MNNYTEIVTNKFLSKVRTFGMLDNIDSVIVGFSGGADSVCLLHLLDSFKEEFGYQLKAVHINHGIRGDEANSDEDFAKNFCESIGIAFEAVKVNCPEEAKATGESLEECGRRLRYTNFNRFCEKNSRIATAHNANDVAETMILNIIRGTTVKGLCGIPSVRDNIIRPIIECSRAEIEGYCRENNLNFVIDSTNLSLEYTRNKIRHEILPVIENINPAFLSSFASLKENASIVSDFVSTNADLLLSKAKKDDNVYDRDVLLCCHPSVCTEALFKGYLQFSGKTLDNKKTKALRKLLIKGGRRQLYGEDFVEVKKDYLRFYRIDKADLNNEIGIDFFPFEAVFGNYTVKLEKITDNSKIVNQFDDIDMIDCNSVSGNLVLRTRRAGDEFTFSKRNVTKTLKKLFTEENIPIENRGKIPVISDDNGVVWVLGFGVTKRCVASKCSDNIILVGGKNNDR